MRKSVYSTKGAVLVTVMMVLSTLIGLSLCALVYTSSVAKNVARSNNYRQEIDMADGALEQAFAWWRETCRAKSNISRPGIDFSGLPLPTAAMFPKVAGFSAQTAANSSLSNPVTLADYKIQAVDPQYNVVDQNATPPQGYGMSIGTRTTYYKASVDAYLPTRGQPMLVKLRRIFEKQVIAPWNYAIFFVDDLEIQPGPAFNVSGWVHSNGNVYTGHNTLNFANKMSYGNDWTIGFMPGETSHNGETPAAPTYPSNQPPTREQGQQPYGLDSTRVFSTTDANPNNDSYREIVEQRNPAYPDPFTDLTDPSAPWEARYYDQADYKVVVGSGGALTILDGNDNVLTNKSTGVGKQIYNLVNSAVTTGQTIQDARESATVSVTTLDVSKIYNAYKPGGSMASTAFGGIIYLTDSTAASAPANQRRAFRLLNGASVPPGGLTIASDDAVYIQGDYNTGTNGGTQPASNFTGAANDPTKPTITGYNREPCAVVADAVMILSNSWQDSNSGKDLSYRQATNTTVNTAIVSGIVPSGTQGSNYSGGAENFPRFLEDWGSDNTLTYYGSMVELYKSKYHTGVWGQNNVYNPPVRNWYFDNKFYVNPPPGSLTLVQYKKGRWFVE